MDKRGTHEWVHPHGGQVLVKQQVKIYPQQAFQVVKLPRSGYFTGTSWVVVVEDGFSLGCHSSLPSLLPSSPYVTLGVSVVSSLRSVVLEKKGVDSLFLSKVV